MGVSTDRNKGAMLRWMCCLKPDNISIGVIHSKLKVVNLETAICCAWLWWFSHVDKGIMLDLALPSGSMKGRPRKQSSGHQSHLPPLRPGIESACGLRFVDLNLTPRVFLRVLQFSSLCKFDFHAKIWAVERLNINLWLGRMGNHFLRNWR